MLELTDFDDSKISYLARISRGHQILPNLSIEDLFRVLDNIVEIQLLYVEMIVAGDHMTQAHLYLMLVME